MRVLITMGPTREPIDSVRFISNASSGKMGLALAKEGKKRGHEVVVVSGPVGVEIPDEIKVINVKTAEEMVNSTLGELRGGYDLMISAAAIADYSPEELREGKMDSSKEVVLRLKPTPKLTRLAREKFPGLFIVAFKAEVNLPEEELLERAGKKLTEENLNLVVANDIGRNIFGSEKTEVWILDGKEVRHVPTADKASIAGDIWNAIEAAMPFFTH
ncbi:MAG: phosphopantothenoylcysteine decarboxylase [Candidatus Altiarchaeota archaeon]|nr:phosphopantothenoylcysteine decarboxylase [Candidatus Altiarchaeota archaeon]